MLVDVRLVLVSVFVDVLGVTVPLGHVCRRGRPLPATTVERNFLVETGLLEAELPLKLGGRQVERAGDDGKREVDSRGY